MPPMAYDRLLSPTTPVSRMPESRTVPLVFCLIAALLGWLLLWEAPSNVGLFRPSPALQRGTSVGSSGAAMGVTRSPSARFAATPSAPLVPSTATSRPSEPAAATTATDLPPMVGVALLGLGAMLAAVGLGGRTKQVTMTPFLGIAQQLMDKGMAPDDDSGDAQSERHRIEQRVAFNNERWRKHRSGSRFGRALGTTAQSGILKHIVNPVIAITVWSVIVCAAQVYFGVEKFNLPTSLFSLSAPSLGLLLVFRTNASYERWDGARKMLGLVKNRSEDLTRQISVRFPADNPAAKAQFMRYLQAFYYALKVHLRGGPGGFENDDNLIEDLTPILKPDELELLLKAPNRPGHVMQCMTQVAHNAGLDGAALFCLDQNLTVLADVLGGCERILRTPIPLSYTRMTTRFLFVWLLLLPLAMSAEIMKLDHSLWLTVPSVAFIAFALLGVEEVGVQIEEPFTILPMETYAAGVKGNTAGIFAQMNDVNTLLSKK